MPRCHRPGIAALLACLLLTVPLAASAAAPAFNGEIKIGVSVSTTGGFSAEAPHYVNDVRLAEKQINQAGGINGKKLTLVILDNQSTNPGAPAALNQAIEQEKVLAYIGGNKSTQILAMADTIKANGIPTMVGGTNASITKIGNPWLFRLRVNDDIVAAILVKYVKEELKLTKIGMIYSNEAFGSGAAEAVSAAAKAQGLTVVAKERLNLGDRDFTAQLLTLKRAGAEVLIPYSAGTEEFARVLVQYRQMGSPFKFIGPPAIAQKPTLDLAKEAAEGLMGFADSVPGMTKGNKEFVEAYQKEYNVEPDPQAPWAYDSVHILANVIRKVGEDRAKIREGILATKNYDGALGIYSFTPDGDGLHGGPIAVIKGGKPQLVKMVTMNP
ncbi:MAG TPA: ABC transporter substrate-binding protein [Candidatus Sulfotelmatobacter sp.]|nr:ABC transporter substrate-binding protein [Candidatus Sulfotelmatobacter sp.]